MQKPRMNRLYPSNNRNQPEEMSSDLPISLPKAQFLSPFRYPGGKTWFLSHIREWLTSRSSKPSRFIEPFAGGASVGLMVAHEELAAQVVLVEIDEDIASVWRIIINGEGDISQLIEDIKSFELTKDSVNAKLGEVPISLNARAFQTILRNRVSRGGILAPGSGLLRRGENDRGLQSRWYPETLAKRILSIQEFRDRISFVKGDAFSVIREALQEQDTMFFIDPPYSATENGAGKRLYAHSEIDHEMLFQLASRLAGGFLMTYDADEYIRELAFKHKFDVQEIAMRNTHHSTKTELVINNESSRSDQNCSVTSHTASLKE